MASSNNTTIEFAGRRTELAAPDIVQALFATISYRLEPQGRGTRFPVIILGLYGGQLNPEEMLAAIAELDVIANDLQALPLERAVRSMKDLTPFRAGNGGAASLFEYFLTLEGVPLVAALRTIIQQARSAASPIRFDSPQVVKDRRMGRLWILVGAAWSICGFIYFPDFVIVPIGSSLRGGPLLWPIGLAIMGLGFLSLFQFRRLRTFRKAQHSHQWIAALIGMAVVALWVAITWRG
jgi:2,3-bisphosphoglycerate-dependent phosphoglycerate mutase